MFRRLQLIVLVLLAVALPIRGYASVTMLFCADAHDVQDIEQLAPQHSVGGSHQHQDHEAMHGDTGQTGHSGNHAPSGSHSDENGAKPGSSGSCSVCGVCCTGVIVGPTFPDVVALAVSTAAVPFTPFHYAGVDLDHAERPPLALILA